MGFDSLNGMFWFGLQAMHRPTSEGNGHGKYKLTIN